VSSKFKPNTTQTPNVLFDRLMYELPDAEFKVLCAIVRKTYGWHKDSDRIANSQFEAMTGKEKRQIQRAKASLKAKGLIRETPPDRQDGIAEYEFLEPDPVSHATPPHDIHDTQGMTSATHTKDTKQKTLNKRVKPIEDDKAIPMTPNTEFAKEKPKKSVLKIEDKELAKPIYDILDRSQFTVEHSKSLTVKIASAIRKHGLEAMKRATASRIQFQVSTGKELYIHNFMTDDTSIGWHKDRINGTATPAKSTLPDFSRIKYDESPIDEAAWQTLTSSKN